MIQLPSVTLPNRTAATLARYQADIDYISDLAQRISRAKRDFQQRNTAKNKTFRLVREKLHEMCSGSRRCHYCEDSCADEVEHFKPKEIYPELTFVWENYLYACGACNRRKTDKFVVFSQHTGLLIDVSRQRGSPILPPELGDPVLINPRRENPLRWMELELRQTYMFLPAGDLSQHEYERARFTIELLDLNRDVLLEARENAYSSYRARLQEYIDQRDTHQPTDQRIHAIKRMEHPSVWFEMKRQANLLDDLRPLFRQAPEALAW
jgi:uncharacterized protein (TIGR02646 family)